jgi:rhamnose transport system substrate-binding protein
VQPLSFQRARLAVALSIAALLLVAACGGGATNSAGSAPHKWKIAFVPKLIGIPYFNAMQKGGDQAAKDLGVEFIYQGPTTADSAKQIEVIDSLISRHVDAIAVAPNDPAAIGPILQRAKSAGIAVYTSDTDAPSTVRQVWVNQATNEGIGTAVIDGLASQMGGSGKWAIVSCGATAQNLNSWIEVEKKRATEKYPNMQLIGVKYAGEDQQAATQVAKDLMTANPDLKGLIGECSVSAPGVAQAVTEMNKTGQVFSSGLATPAAMSSYIKSGAMGKVIIWDVANLGYLTVWAGKQILEKKDFQPDNNVGGSVGSVKYSASEKMLLLGPPLVLTKDNIDQYASQF